MIDKMLFDSASFIRKEFYEDASVYPHKFLIKAGTTVESITGETYVTDQDSTVTGIGTLPDDKVVFAGYVHFNPDLSGGAYSIDYTAKDPGVVKRSVILANRGGKSLLKSLLHKALSPFRKQVTTC